MQGLALFGCRVLTPRVSRVPKRSSWLLKADEPGPLYREDRHREMVLRWRFEGGRAVSSMLCFLTLRTSAYQGTFMLF